MRKTFVIAMTIGLLVSTIQCGGSEEEQAEAQKPLPDSAGYTEISDTSGMLIVEYMTPEEIEENYESIVIAEAPDFTVYDLNQNAIELDDFEGYVLLLNFWSMESPVSKRLFPTLSEVQNEFRERKFTVLGICVDRRPIKAIQEAADFNRLTYPVAFPGSTDIYGNYAVTGAGKSVLIDSRGNIVGDFYDDPGTERLKRVINLFLNI
ncbi:MAG TPA: redoxin domain-containing protein [candidate division Zixibacteria bacterium]|nr:redoxin domain-containing protein [candidate division Zixibacteria bacterium]